MAFRITACCLQKGGTGKSSTVHALSAGLILRGYRVLVCDLDPQGNLSHTMRANTNDKGLFEAFNGDSAVDLIQHTQQGHILASSQQLVGSDKKFVDVGSEYLLADALEQIKNDYDYIIIDTPPHLGILTVCALVAATDIIIPTTSDMYAMQGLALLAQNIEKIKRRTNPYLRIAGILLTRYSSRSILSRDFKEVIEAQAVEIGTKVYNTIIREGVAIREAQAQRINIFECAPTSNPAMDYNDFIEEYLNEGGNTNG